MIGKSICKGLSALTILQIIVLPPAFLNAQEEIKHDSMVVQTIEKMKQAKDWDELLPQARILRDIGKPAAPEILKAFQNKNNEEMFRKFFADLLGGIKDQKSIPGVVEILQDEKETPAIRSKAAYCLGKMGYPEACAPLRAQLKNDDYLIKSTVVFALGLLKDQGAFSAIGEATKDKNEWVRNNAARALGMLANSAGIDYLTPLLNDKIDHVRLASIQSLGIIGTEKTVAPLLNGLKDAVAVTEKAIVIQALGKTKSQKAADTLINILKNEDSYLAMNAAEALSLIGDKRAIPLIEDRMKAAQDSFVRGKYEAAYKKLTE
ncbi:MAG: putative lyase [candidate division TA06 bacterium ADurb.Bin417]|uniref:Putative lyase n=1 Tax=candidate division TA06 bacterium ADurb.Bin417 TaxID=1852828 RepID=A0A1V5MKP6_UNCT6|nr:MAG: putative lyase [candidate division TA06 bacterium ADurb.Bin417]